MAGSIEIVILAGGGGTRLHPLSTPERPKPFLPLLAPGADGTPETLIQRTVRRLRDGSELACLEPASITVVAAAAHVPVVDADADADELLNATPSSTTSCSSRSRQGACGCASTAPSTPCTAAG